MSMCTNSRCFRPAVMMLCGLLLSGCTYLGNRGRDFGDMLTLSTETGAYAVSAQLLPLPVGFGQSEGRGCGFRSGAFGKYSHDEHNLFTLGGKSYAPDDDPRSKGYSVSWEWMPMPFFLHGIDGPRRVAWQFELGVAVGVGIRAGISLAEMADFFLGLGGVDILDDDREAPDSAETDEKAGKQGAAAIEDDSDDPLFD